jgi:hypothetical protein
MDEKFDDELGTDLTPGKGVYACEMGDHGNTKARFGLNDCCQREGQGEFEMLGVMDVKDSYENLKNSIFPHITSGRYKLKKSHLLEVTWKGEEKKPVIAR